MSSTLATVLQRSLNGVVTIWLYFADVISDIEVRPRPRLDLDSTELRLDLT